MSEFVLVTIDKAWDNYIAENLPQEGLGDAVQELMEFVTGELTSQVTGHVLVSLTAGSLMPPAPGALPAMKGPPMSKSSGSVEPTSSWWKN